MACATAIAHMKIAKRYPSNSDTSRKIKHKLAFAFGVAVFLAGLCGVAATTILWFSTGTLVAWLTLMSGAAVMAACVAVQINEDGLGAYLPGALRKKLMRMSLLEVLLDRTVANQISAFFRYYQPKFLQVARVLVANGDDTKFQGALRAMDPSLRHMLQREGTVYLLPGWLQRVLLPRRIRLSPAYVEQQRLRSQQALLPTAQDGDVAGGRADFSPSRTAAGVASVLSFARMFAANKANEALACVRPRVMLVGALTGGAALVQFSSSPRTRRWLLAVAATMTFLTCSAISGGAGLLLLLQRRFRTITSGWEEQHLRDRAATVPAAPGNSAPSEIVAVGRNSVFRDVLNTRPRNVIGFFCFSLVMFLLRRRARW